MRHPMMGTLRRDLVLAVTLVAVATAALAAAAHWSAPPKAAATIAGSDQKIGTSKTPGDIQLGTVVSPLFTEARRMTVAETPFDGDVALPAAAAEGIETASYHAAGAGADAGGGNAFAFGSSRPRASSSGGSGGFGGGG